MAAFLDAHVAEFDLHEWCVKNGFKDLFPVLVDFGVSTEEDLIIVKEDLEALGVTKPFVQKKFCQKADETFSTYKELQEVFDHRERITKMFQHDLFLLGKLVKGMAISMDEYNQKRSYERAKYFEAIGMVDGDDDVEVGPTEPSIQVHPQRHDVYLDVSFKSNSGKETYLGSSRSTVVNFESVKDDGVFHCVSFVVPAGDVSEAELQNGAFSEHPKAPMGGAKRADAITLRSFDIVKAGPVFTPSFIDTGASDVSVKFVHQDKPLGAADMTGTFITAQGKSFELTGKTDDDGRVIRSLPPGRIQCVVKASDGKPIDASTDVKERPEITDPVNIPEPVELNIISDSTKLAYLPSSWTNARPVLVLGDISGSMGAGHRMDHLKSTLTHLYEEATSNGGRIGLAVWDTNIYFCKETYVGKDDEANVNSWTRDLRPRGGNNMQQAIEKGMAKFPDAKDVFVMCDGDVDPFSRKLPMWTQFTQKYTQQGVRFHTVAFAEDADHQEMQLMAEVCGGMFTSANKTR